MPTIHTHKEWRVQLEVLECYISSLRVYDRVNSIERIRKQLNNYGVEVQLIYHNSYNSGKYKMVVTLNP